MFFMDKHIKRQLIFVLHFISFTIEKFIFLKRISFAIDREILMYLSVDSFFSTETITKKNFQKIFLETKCFINNFVEFCEN